MRSHRESRAHRFSAHLWRDDDDPAVGTTEMEYPFNGLCYNVLFMPWSDEMNDGFAFAALLARRVDGSGSPPEAYVSRGAFPTIEAHLDALRAGTLVAAQLVPSLRPRPKESALDDDSARVRAVVGALLPMNERRKLAQRGPLPTPRRGYEALPALAPALAHWRSDADEARSAAQECKELEEEVRAWSESKRARRSWHPPRRVGGGRAPHRAVRARSRRQGPGRRRRVRSDP